MNSGPLARIANPPSVEVTIGMPSAESSIRTIVFACPTVGPTPASRSASFIKHRDTTPEAELLLYGVRLKQVDSASAALEWSRLHPANEWKCWVVFPLFLGAACVGNLECRVTFRKCDGAVGSGAEAELHAGGATLPAAEQSSANRNRTSWFRHFRELRWVFSRATELWCQFAFGNLMRRPQDDPAHAAQFSDQVAQLCGSLNDAERRLLELRLQGYSPAECAVELGLSAVAFRVRLTRLRQRLRATGVLDDWL